MPSPLAQLISPRSWACTALRARNEVIDEHRHRLIAAARAQGKHAAMLVQTIEEAERWIDAGASIIAYSSDT
jgi:2-keto-3-deoxy-L-rhamnonate aldolase RhmA